ncbi:cytochrome P450 [Actinomadura sp. KC06]|uniref:cytochrome P450 n=1 Tax=Actinomadura sp. KC06 TaxID=2530369 RepID=UPI001044A2F7|nr:cytochrome P450 [Actinomadura sp. KC06]TDD34955.1 cytochrome P450 [Actinomadura sp. KC06]
MNPIDAVTHADPYPYYAELVAERPLAFDESLGLWVAAGAAQVTDVLRAPGLRVRPPGQPVPPGITGTAAGRVFGSLVRMNDGEAHTRLKSVVTAALTQADPATARGLAESAVKSDLDGGPPDLGALMFTVPVRVVAGLCGLTEREAAEAAALTGDFVKCLRPDADTGQLRAADAAAERLTALLPPEPRPGGGLLTALVRAAGEAVMPPPGAVSGNAVGLLSQTYDATAGLIGNTLLALAREGGRPRPLEPFVREVARHDAPIQNTRRFAAEPTRCGTAEIEPGQAVLVVLAAANRDPAVNPDPHTFVADRPAATVFTFGAAAHRCPGQDLATAIAAGAVGALLDHGFDPSADVPRTAAYRPSPNARIPDFSRVVDRAHGT